MTRRGRVRAATDRAAEKRRNSLAFSDAAVRPIPVRVTKNRSTSVLLFFCADAPNARTQRVRYARAWVRICHSEIGELAHQAESAQIFAKGEIPVTLRCSCFLCIFALCVIEPTRGVRAPNWVRAIASPSPTETSQARRLPVRGFFYRLRPLIDPSAIPQKVQKTNKQRCLQCLPTCAKIQVKSFWRPCS